MGILGLLLRDEYVLVVYSIGGCFVVLNHLDLPDYLEAAALAPYWEGYIGQDRLNEEKKVF
jgi:hypothetical protein